MRRTSMEMSAYRQKERNIGIPDLPVYRADMLWSKRGFGSKVREAKKRIAKQNGDYRVWCRRQDRFAKRCATNLPQTDA